MHQQEIPNSPSKSPRFLSYVEAHSWKMRKGKKVTILIILHEHDVCCKSSTNNQEQSGSIFSTPWDPSLALWASTCFAKVPHMDYSTHSCSMLSLLGTSQTVATVKCLTKLRCHQIVQLGHVILSCK
jgi:hypothetical protein